LKDYEVKLHVNPEVQLVAQKVRKISYGLMIKLKQKQTVCWNRELFSQHKVPLHGLA